MELTYYLRGMAGSNRRAIIPYKSNGGIFAHVVIQQGADSCNVSTATETPQHNDQLSCMARG